MKAVGIIPARWQSTRFPGKPLHLIANKPLLRHVWERCRRAKKLDAIIIATDDMRIAKAAFAWGAEVAMTSPKHQSGTDRIAEVARKARQFGLVINIQGDEPLTEPALLDRSVSTKRSSRAGSVSGSSPWIFITRPNCLAFRATSAIRSVPLWCFGEVIATSAPQAKAALAIRMSSVAMMIASNFFARRQRSQTCRRSGLFAMRCSGFPGKRVDCHRAGIIPTAFILSPSG